MIMLPNVEEFEAGGGGGGEVRGWWETYWFWPVCLSVRYTCIRSVMIRASILEFYTSHQHEELADLYFFVFPSGFSLQCFYLFFRLDLTTDVGHLVCVTLHTVLHRSI